MQIDFNGIIGWLVQPEVITAGLIFIATLVVYFVVQRYLLSKVKWLEKYGFGDILYDAVDGLGWITAIITATFFMTRYLPDLPGFFTNGIYFLFIFTWTWQAIMLLSRTVDYVAKSYINRIDEGSNQAIIRFLASVVKVFLWIIAGLLVLSNLGYDINSLIAGLGIGGVAVALAVQAILSDVISSLSIVIDKPFKVGDFIILNDSMGTVEKIGLRSTRIAAIDGEEIIMPNAEMVNGVVHNYGRVQKRRALHKIGITYETDSHLIKEIPSILLTILRSHGQVDKESVRAHLIEFGDSAIIYEINFYVTTSEYEKFLDVQQEILLQIRNKFEEEGVEFAYPTQTVHLQKT